MPKSANDLFTAFQKRLIRLNATREKVEQLHKANQILKFDVEQIYSGLFLDAFVSFERYIEELFIGYLSGRITAVSAKVQTNIVFRTNQLVIDVLLSGKSYVDWIPYDQTLKRADIFFKNGHPFTALTAQQKGVVLELHRIRNALAHRSDHAMEIFKRLVVGSLPVHPLEKRPPSFLRSLFRTSPNQTRFENYLFEILSIAQKLSSA